MTLRRLYLYLVSAVSLGLLAAGLALLGNTVLLFIFNDPYGAEEKSGAIYGRGYHELQSHCFAYIHATEVGGTHPALIEAMGHGALVLYLNTPENAEVAGDAAIPFEAGELCQKLELVLNIPEAERAEWGRRAMERVAERYSWDRVTEEYEQLLLEMRYRRPRR